MGAVPTLSEIVLATALALITLALVQADVRAQPAGPECPEGYRLHYQGFCINKTDEQGDDPVAGVRGLDPISSQEADIEAKFKSLERTGYKFSTMKDGEHCRRAFVSLRDRTSSTALAAFALGDESCGVSHDGVATEGEAEASALEECRRHTKGCRIIAIPKIN